MAATALIVEDDPSVARALGRLVAHGFEALYAKSRADGIRLVNERADVGLILIDVGLENETHGGLAVLEAAARRRAEVPRAIVSGTGDPHVMNAAVRLGAYFVAKPFQRDDVEALVRAALDRVRPVDLAERVAERSRVWKLSPQQASILEKFVVHGMRRADICRELECSENTFKSHVRLLLAKARSYDSLQALAVELLRDTQR